MNGRNFLFGATAGLALAVLTACSGGDDESDSQKNKATEQINDVNGRPVSSLFAPTNYPFVDTSAGIGVTPLPR